MKLKGREGSTSVEEGVQGLLGGGGGERVLEWLAFNMRFSSSELYIFAYLISHPLLGKGHSQQ